MTDDIGMSDSGTDSSRFDNTEISDEVMLDRIGELRKRNLSACSDTPSDDYTEYDCLSYAWLVLAAISAIIISYGIKSAFIFR